MTTVLIVDDSAVDQQIAGACVRQTGCAVTHAASGREALTVMKRDKPDVVLTDLKMPEMGGLELVRKLTSSYPNVPVILMISAP